MLKITGSTRPASNAKEIKGKIDGNSVIGNLVCYGEATNPIKRRNQTKTTKSKILVKSKNHDFPKSRNEEAETGFFTPKARLAFTQLRQAFVKASIFHHFDLKNHIRIEINVSSCVIKGVLS